MASRSTTVAPPARRAPRKGRAAPPGRAASAGPGPAPAAPRSPARSSPPPSSRTAATSVRARLLPPSSPPPAGEGADGSSLEERLRRAELRAKAFQDVGLALGSTLDLDQLLELILRKTAELLEADRATLYLLDEQRGRLLSRIVIGDQAQSIELPLGQGIAGMVAKVGQPIRVRDAYRDRRFNRTWDELTGYRTRSILAAPMKNHVGRTIGVIQVLNKRAGAEVVEFTAHDEELIGALATQAAISIDNSRLFLSVIQKNMQLVETKEQLEQRVADLKLLFELESAMGRAATLSDLARAVVVEAARACEAQGGGLLVDEGDDGVWLYHLDLHAVPAGVEPEVRRVPIKRGEGLIGLAMRTNQSQHWVADAGGAATDGRPVLSPRLAKLFGIVLTSAVAMPLEGPEDVAIGAIGLYNASRPTGFSQDARALLRLISANVSTAVRLFRSRVDRERAHRLSTIGRFLSGVMHDLKTPMSIIGGYAQLMAETADPRERHAHAELLLRQLEVIGSMQRELLDFARGKKSLWVRKVYLVPFALELEKEISRELEGTKVKLEVDVDHRGTARFDEHKIVRALHNLVRNAIDAMGERGGRLTVRFRRDGDDLLIQVADTGKGVPVEIRDRLFGSFVTAGKPQGTGLGLSIVKKIVEEHQGSVQVATGSQGSVFTLRLPQPGEERASLLPEPPSEPDRAERRPAPAVLKTKSTRRAPGRESKANP